MPVHDEESVDWGPIESPPTKEASSAADHPAPPPYLGVKDVLAHGKGLTMTVACEVVAHGTINGTPVDDQVKTLARSVVNTMPPFTPGASSSSASG